MQGNLCAKSKVTYTVKPINLVRKRVKRERCSTPQRWSRRIRSLPPIPFNVLVARRKINRTLSISKKEKTGNKTPLKMKRMTKSSCFPNKSTGDQSNSVVRIVPVVVYVKNTTKPSLKSSLEEVKVQINGKLLSEAFNTYVNRDIKIEPPEKRRSRRLRMLPPSTGNNNMNFGSRQRKRQ